MVDLVVCVGRHGCHGHRLALAGERFVGLVAEDIAQVGDRGVDFGDSRCGEGIERETGDGGRRLITSEPIQTRGEGSQSGTHIDGVARVVVVADGHSGVFERGQRVAVFGFESGQTAASSDSVARLPLS